MSRTLPQALKVLILSTVFSLNASAATFYVATSGSDSNSGTSESSPWAHLPGMQTWTGSHTPAAGDTFILRGCDVWGNSNFPILWKWSGSSGNLITIDRDITWYNTANCPSGWNRAVWNAGGTQIGGAANECSGGSDTNWFLRTSGAYIQFSWIEAKGLYWAGTCSDAGFIGALAGTANAVFDHWYFHAWSANHSSAADIAGLVAVQPGTACGQSGVTSCTLSYPVFDNTDGDTSSGGGCQIGNCMYGIYNSMPNAIKPYISGEIGGNYITNTGISGSFSGLHLNCIETTAATGTGIYYIHDNVISGNSSCEGLQVGNPGETDYVWNNIWNSSGGGNNGPQSPQSETPVGMYFWNNTVGGGWGQCIKNAGHGSSYGTYFYAQNNHCINSGSAITDGTFTATNLLISDNVGMTQATATSQGYTTSENYIWSPVSGCTPATCSTLGAGTTGAPSYAPTGTSPSGGTFTTNDTIYACTEGTVNGVVQPICPTRTTTNARTSSWDAGAFQWGSSSQPAAPTGLAALVQ